MENLKLSDDSISTIAKLLQIAILTGTDIVDNLRMVTFTVNDGKLVPTQQFIDNLNGGINSMLDKVELIKSETETVN
jgi:hypothetical protein